MPRCRKGSSDRNLAAFHNLFSASRELLRKR